MHTYITTTAALSVNDSDDDCCVSYTVTMVDVRSCTRPPRSPDQLPTSVYICKVICTYIYVYTYILTYIYFIAYVQYCATHK